MNEKDDAIGVCIDEVGGEPGSERGERAVLVAEDVHCDECGRRHDIEVCPKCGSFIELGFGLAFGGCGEYKFCASEECDWFWKRETED